MNVTLVDKMGTDLTVVNAARVSFGKKKTKLEVALEKGRSFKKEKVFEEDMDVKVEPGDRTPVKILMESDRNELFAPKKHTPATVN